MSASLATTLSPIPPVAKESSRRPELDWLRTLVVLGIIPYHALVIFGASSAIYIKSAQANPALALVGSFVLTWGIPLIFLMAGAAGGLALERRQPGAYLRERVGRLLVPLLIVAFLFSPLQDYLILRANPSLVSMSPVPIQHPEQLSQFPAFYWMYLTTLFTSVRQYSPAIGTLALAHVWFVPRLLVVSLITLPLFLYLRGRGRRWIERLTTLGMRPAGLLLAFGLAPAVMVALTQSGWLGGLSARWPFTDEWPAFLLDFFLFIAGFVIYASPRLRAAVRQHCFAALALGIAYWLMFVLATAQGPLPTADFAPYAWLSALTSSLASWLLALALLGLAMRFLTFTRPWQRYLTTATFPMYLLHMPLLTVFAYFLVKLPVPWYAQLMLIIGLTAVGVFSIYDLVIRRTPLTRFLFGAKAVIREEHPMRARVPDAPPQGEPHPGALYSEAPATVADEFANLAQLFRERTARFAELPRWRQRQGDTWRSATYQEHQRLVNRVMCGLDALGAHPGDRIGILSNTRWEWVVADWAITGLGCVLTTIYPTLTPETAAFILRDSGARFLFVEDGAQYRKVAGIRANLLDLERMILLDDETGIPADPMVITWSGLLALSQRSAEDADLFAATRAAEIPPDAPAALIYTSGTTGLPKGVIHTHRTLLAQLAGAWAMLTTVHAGMRDLLFLPLSHVLGRLEHLFSFEIGAEMVIEPELANLSDDLLEIKPDVLLGVPRVYEKMDAVLRARLAAASGLERAIFQWAERVGRQAVPLRQAGHTLPAYMRLRMTLADWLAFRRVRAAFGGHLQFAICGGAPLDPAIAAFFHAAGVPLLEGWGLTETGGAITFNQVERFRIGTVGRPYPGHQIRIAEDGEILVRGPCVFPRYHNNPAATAEALDAEGWFHTGDIGTLDADGFLSIVDRKKELLITASGKKVAPQRIEALLNRVPLVAQSCVYGDRKPYIVALLTLDWVAVTRWAERQGLTGYDARQLADAPALRAAIEEHIAAINTQLARFEQVKYFGILADDFTVGNGLLTPTLKIRRRAITERYRGQFEALYQPTPAAIR